MQKMWRSSGTCFPRRTKSHRAAILHKFCQHQFQKSGKEVANNLLSNPLFAPLNTVANNLQSATSVLEKTYNASRTRDKEKMAEMREAQQKFKALFVSVASGVQTVSAGDETTILASGMEVRKKRSPAALPEVPVQFTAKALKQEGVVEMKWKKSARAKSYRVEYTTDPVVETAFEEAGTVTKTKFRFEGLKSVTKYWFRVYAINDEGISGWSEYAFAVTN